MERNKSETLASYISEDGERIRVVTGNSIRFGTINGRTKKRITEYSTLIYVGGNLQQVYREADLAEEDIPAFRPIISEAVQAKSSFEELITSIDCKIEEMRDS